MWKTVCFFILSFYSILGEINKKPILQPIFIPNNLKENQNLKLNCEVAEGDLPITFEWFHNNKIINDDTKKKLTLSEEYSRLTIKKLSYDDIGRYECKVKNSFGESSMSVLVSVDVKPKWIKDSDNITYSLKEMIEIDCNAIGYPSPKIEILKKKSQDNFERISLLNNKYQFVLTREKTGLYECRAENVNGFIKKNIHVNFKSKL